MSKVNLTNEKLNKKFESPFVLVNFAIKQAKIKIQRGDVRTSNAAIETLLELLGREDFRSLEDCPVEPKAEFNMKGVQAVSGNVRRKDPSAYSWSDVK